MDPNLVAFHGIDNEMAKSVGHTADMAVDAKFAQLLQLRVAQMNEYSYCFIPHTEAADDQDIHPAKVAQYAKR